MKTKIDFKILDYVDIEFDTHKPSIEDQKAFSDFLAKRKNAKAKITQPLVVRV
ncbi:hypothetical protein [Emticicia sp. SJ17W-69]|uniref:hypothetical protein n=1 Tax=Emticicia sp. SJ17W-69 TaxID=3421657 RepID=UPI003EBAAA97